MALSSRRDSYVDKQGDQTTSMWIKQIFYVGKMISFIWSKHSLLAITADEQIVKRCRTFGQRQYCIWKHLEMYAQTACVLYNGNSPKDHLKIITAASGGYQTSLKILKMFKKFPVQVVIIVTTGTQRVPKRCSNSAQTAPKRRPNRAQLMVAGFSSPE